VSELFHLTQKQGNPISPAVLLADIARSREFVFSELGQAQLEMMAAVQGIVDMHDRLIVAEALVRQAPIITKDEALRRSGLAPVIW
jgi:PIN domain nuclease of toxin-antitoxin system